MSQEGLIFTTENVTLITLNNSELCFVSSVLELLSGAGVNIDMFAQTPPQGKRSTFSFTVADDSLGKALEAIADIREAHPDIKPIVSSGNCKLLVSCDRMRNTPGFAARLLKAAADARVDARPITTSEIDISILVTSADRPVAESALRQALSKL